MALVPPIEASAEEVRELLAPLRNDLSIAIYNSQNAFNIGAIIRVAHSYLVREIIVIGEERWYERASMGMHRFETIVRVPDVDAFFEHVGDRPIWSVEKDHATVSLYDVVEYPRDVVFVMGSESEGVPQRIIERSGAVIGIPMYGINHSFPITVASGIVLCDWARKRYRPGTVVTGPQLAPRSAPTK